MHEAIYSDNVPQWFYGIDHKYVYLSRYNLYFVFHNHPFYTVYDDVSENKKNHKSAVH